MEWLSFTKDTTVIGYFAAVTSSQLGNIGVEQISLRYNELVSALVAIEHKLLL